MASELIFSNLWLLRKDGEFGQGFDLDEVLRPVEHETYEVEVALAKKVERYMDALVTLFTGVDEGTGASGDGGAGTSGGGGDGAGDGAPEE